MRMLSWKGRKSILAAACDWFRWRMILGARHLGRRFVRPLGVMAECRIRIGYWPNLVRPRRLTEHLAAERAFRRFDRRHVITADKLAARDWVAERVGPEILNRVHRVARVPEELRLEDLPDACAVRATHVQGGNLLVPDKRDLDETALREFAQAQLQRQFGKDTFEDYYLEVPPRLIVEDWLGTTDGVPPDDFKFHVFSGRPLVVMAGRGRFERQTWSYYDADWNRLAVRNSAYPPGADIPRPVALERMLEVAATLGRDFDYCRVDLYDLDGRVVFGEITHFPGAGYFAYEPREFDRVLGDLLHGADAAILRPWREGGACAPVRRKAKPAWRRAIDWIRWRGILGVRALGRLGVRPLGPFAECRIRLGYWPNLLRPRRFTEHLLARCAFKRFESRHTITADKWAVRAWVEDRVGPNVLTRLYQVVADPDELDWNALPDRFMIKATHVQGGNFPVIDKASTSESEVRAFCRAQLARRFGRDSYESFYLQVPPRVIVEEWLGTELGESPTDYKFQVFHGEPLYISHISGRQSGCAERLYSADWMPLAVHDKDWPRAPLVDAPPELAEMLRIAATLGRDFDYVRVDLYALNGRVIFGELTHVTNAGYVPYEPVEFDWFLGAVLEGQSPLSIAPWLEGVSTAKAMGFSSKQATQR